MNPVAEALSRPEAYPHPVETGTDIQVVETHISWIFLTGAYAYKLKKPVDLGFLDFSTLEQRQRCCFEELRLNRRLCPDLYLEVLPVTEANGSYRIGGDAPAVDYVVRMLQFDRKFELDRLLRDHALTIERIGEIATIVAAFHRTAQHAEDSSHFGTPEVLLEPMIENLDITEQIVHTPGETAAMETIRQWTLDEHRRLGAFMRRRKASGFIRECHGDMHTGNMVIWRGSIAIFDCIEFNRKLSVIDVISDASFLFMDLSHSGQTHLAWHFLNAYLAGTGDYAGLALLRLYCTYRAMVRTKVTAIRFSQENDAEKLTNTLDEHRSYLALALGYVRPSAPVLVLMHGVSGCGKSVLASKLADTGGFVHVRSDLERKRLFNIAPEGNSSLAGVDIYTPQASEQTYSTLLDAAESALSGGFTVIVDATFLRYDQRSLFIELAERMSCRCRILCLHAPVATLMERVRERLLKGTDPSEADPAIVEAQLRTVEAPAGNEKSLCIGVDTQGPVDHAALAATLLI